MDLKIVKEEKSALPRKEIECTLTYENVTPSRSQLVQSIASKTKAKELLVIVKKIDTTYGDKTAKVVAYVYDNEDVLNAIEYKKVIEKNTPKAPEPKAEENKEDNAGESKEESSTEDKKEDSVPTADAPSTDKKEGEQ